MNFEVCKIIYYIVYYKRKIKCLTPFYLLLALLILLILPYIFICLSPVFMILIIPIFTFYMLSGAFRDGDEDDDPFFD